MRPDRPFSMLTLLTFALALGACNPGELGDDGGLDGGPVDGKVASDGGAGGGGGSGGGRGDAGVLDGPEATCAVVAAQASVVKKPVDIIMVIDNSCSMTEEIVATQQNINTNFAQMIGNSGIDYRVILLSKHGSASSDQSICITAPLSGNASCSPPPARPTNGARFFHYSTEIGSYDSLRKIRDTYNVADPSGAAPRGWSQWLRPEAFKVFLEITDDDESTLAATAFDTAMLSKTPAMFGTPLQRNYLMHAITGMPQKADSTAPYLPNEPKVANARKCSTAEKAGEKYQDVAILTGGLRFPVCDPSKFDTVFRKIAAGVVAGAQVACEFNIPPAPAGWNLSNRIDVRYSPHGTGAAQSFTQVSGAASCAGAGKAFYTSNGKVSLCPEACAAVKADEQAKLEVLFTCEPGGIN